MAVRTPFNRRRSGNPRPADKRQGDTQVRGDGQAAPRLPHERDESADSQSSAPRAEIVQAGEDLKRGLQDTDRGPVADGTYRRLKNSAP